MVQISYFKLLVTTVFRPALALLTLLLVPLPKRLSKSVVRVSDIILFVRPHPGIPVTLFWVVVTICSLTFATDVQELQKVRGLYFTEKSRRGPQFKDRDRWIVKILGSERGCWISGCCLLVWVMIHRYRKQLKKEFALDDQIERLNVNLKQQWNLNEELKTQLRDLNSQMKTKASSGKSGLEPTESQPSQGKVNTVVSL